MDPLLSTGTCSFPHPDAVTSCWEGRSALTALGLGWSSAVLSALAGISPARQEVDPSFTLMFANSWLPLKPPGDCARQIAKELAAASGVQPVFTPSLGKTSVIYDISITLKELSFHNKS